MISSPKFGKRIMFNSDVDQHLHFLFYSWILQIRLMFSLKNNMFFRL